MTVGINATSSVDIDKLYVDEEVTTTGNITTEVSDLFSGGSEEYPLHIVFCIDKSGSMSGKKIDTANKGLREAVRQLSKEDQYGIVSFNKTGYLEQEKTKGNQSPSVRLEANGGTSISSGLSSARDLLKQMRNSGGLFSSSEQAVEWVVLISDGKGDIPGNRNLERNYSQEGITIQAAEVGGSSVGNKMRKVAQTTQGEFEAIGSARDIKRFFKEEIEKAQSVVALDAEMEIEPHDMTTIDEVYYKTAEKTSIIEPEQRGDTYVLDLGDIEQDNPPKVDIKMSILPQAEHGTVQLIEATLKTSEGNSTDSILVDEVVDPEVEKILKEEGETEDGEDEEEGIIREDQGSIISPEFVKSKVSTLSQEGNLQEARDYLEEHRDILSSDEYQEVKSMIDSSDVSGLGKL